MVENNVLPLTDKQARALQILREHAITYASQFARKFFPRDMDGWRRICKVGNGSARGVCMNTAAGGYLGKLRRKGLIYHGGHGRKIELTDLGIRSLDAFEILQRNEEAREAIIYSPDEEEQN